MKYNAIPPFIFAFALTALCLITSPFSLAAKSPVNTKADTNVGTKRWFEIEVILFKQITKNTENTENNEEFFPQDLSYKKQRALDLLAPYLQPDIKIIKQLLPNCEATQASSPYNVNTQPYKLWVNNVDIETLTTALTETSSDKDNDSDNTITVYPENSDENQTSPHMTVTVITEEADKSELANATPLADSQLDSSQINEDIDTSEALASQKFSSALPADERLTSAEEEQQAQYINIELENYQQYPTTIDKGICIIPSEAVKKHLTVEQLKDFNIDGFPVEKQPTTINGIEQWQDDENGEITWASDSPYLISQDSLRLKSIANRIKRSRNYKPLLHLGWRQVGEGRKQAKAIRLYAGENLALDYQQRLMKQHDEQLAIARQALLEQDKEQNKEQQFAEVLGENQAQSIDNVFEYDHESLKTGRLNTTEESIALTEAFIEEKVHLHAQQQQLNNIFEQYSLLAELAQTTNATSDPDSYSKQLGDIASHKSPYNEADVKRVIAELSADITTPKSSLALDTTIAETTIKPPAQPWYLDGIFKVHLDHYLYINSEFNILDKDKNLTSTAVNQESAKQSDIINFKQDRRVITGEIHYFDHPHMGMVVQIRRFDPTKPAAEAVTQSKK